MSNIKFRSNCRVGSISHIYHKYF